MLLQILIIFYVLSVAYNLFVFNDLEKEALKNTYHYIKYWIVILSGPILCLKLLYVDISAKIYWYKEKKKLAKEIKIQLLQLFKENNIIINK